MAPSSGRIVVGLDGSPGGRAALAFALRDAARRGAATEVVAAFDTAETLAALCGSAVPFDSSTTELREAVGREATAVVDAVRAELADAGEQPTRVTVTAVGGDAIRTLLHAARGADLLVVGSRGRGGFASAVLGSVGVQSVVHAPCPVTVVHPVAATPRRRFADPVLTDHTHGR